MSIDSKTSYLPNQHMSKLVSEIEPSMRYKKGEDVATWQRESRQKLCELLGLEEIEKFACDNEFTIDFDKTDYLEGFREIRFRFFSEEGVIVPCHLVIPIDAKEPLPVVVCLQGHSTGMHISLGRAVYGEKDVNLVKGGDRDFAIRTIKEGYAAVTVEQRCFGESGNDPKTGDPACRHAAMRALLIGRTLIGERVWDIMRTIDILENKFAELIDKDRVICLGNSGGGTATIYASALDERIKVSVPSCALCTFADSIAAVSHCHCNYIPHISKYFDMGELCGMIAPRGLVVVNGKEDKIFPEEGAKRAFSYTKEIYKAAGAKDKCYHIFGPEGHRFYADAAWPTINKLIKEI